MNSTRKRKTTRKHNKTNILLRILLTCNNSLVLYVNNMRKQDKTFYTIMLAYNANFMLSIKLHTSSNNYTLMLTLRVKIASNVRLTENKNKIIPYAIKLTVKLTFNSNLKVKLKLSENSNKAINIAMVKCNIRFIVNVKSQSTLHNPVPRYTFSHKEQAECLSFTTFYSIQLCLSNSYVYFLFFVRRRTKIELFTKYYGF